MFDRHVSKKLLAYRHDELDAEESRRVSEHLARCERCRLRYDDIKLAVRLAEHLPQVTAPDSLWHEVKNLMDEARPTRTGRRNFFPSPWPRLALASAMILTLIVIGASVYFIYRTKTGWPVEHLKADTEQVTGTDLLAVGESLDTGSESKARIAVGLIGEVTLDPNSRLRLVEADVAKHRIALDRGRLEAHVTAPPRLFLVDTPTATAIDLGCAYTLEVSDDGSALLHVTSGIVALEWQGREVEVPIGAMCESRRGFGPGAPYFETATDELIAALKEFDFEGGGDAALGVVMAQADERDTFTLWNLLQRVDEPRRNRIFDRMVELVGLPDGVTREGIIKLDPAMLRLWADELDTVWY
jgi:predicted anti-sigma-YlaC factor YlaD